ncbi:MAG: c-type cytochrome biogenesis protein CcmI [Rhodospirillales bacterium]|nr:c-type cytochrome biogenesis protein CcmI [Rhodospirillales bacterium]
MFWIIAGLLTLIVVAALLVPLFLSHRDAVSRAEYDINVYKDQLIELERDTAAGRIAASEADAARLEVQRRLLAAGEDAENQKTAPAKGSKLPIIIAVAALPAIALAFYLRTGSPSMPDFPLVGRTDVHSAAAGSPENQAINQLVGKLEEKLQQDPNDPKGWVLLGRTYAELGESRKSAAAYERATKLIGRVPGLLADWAEARLMATDGKFTPEIFADFVEAREKDPLLPKPWFYIGLDKAMGGDLRGAAQIWTDLLAIQPKGAPFAEAVKAQIARAADEGGFKVSDLQPSETALGLAKGMAASLPAETAASTAAPSAAPTAPGPNKQDIEAAGQMTPEERMSFIRSMVARLADKLKEDPTDKAGWERLIRAYEVLGETDKATEARAKLKALQ